MLTRSVVAVTTTNLICDWPGGMTMLSFGLAFEEAADVSRWAERLGIGESELIRESLRRHLRWLASEDDSQQWGVESSSEDRSALAAIADWGKAEDWSDWTDATARGHASPTRGH